MFLARLARGNFHCNKFLSSAKSPTLLYANMSTSRYAAVHKNTNGPNDARPTAIQIVKDEGLIGKLAGKTMVITGCSSGIGVETARALHATGADVYLTVRDTVKGEEVLQDIQKTSSGGGKLEVLKLELDSLHSVKECAADFLRRCSQLNVLICNAGVMACPEGRTKDGFETQFGTNHLGHFLLFQLLKPALLASSTPEFNSRVVTVSSSGHRTCGVQFDDLDLSKQGYNPWKAYGQAKTANIYMANEIERRHGAQGLHATSLMPGGIATPLQRHMDQAFLQAMMKNAAAIKYVKSTEQGAATTVWAAIGKDWEGTGGKYLEDCGTSPPRTEPGPEAPGYAPHAYDEEAARKLWDVSLKLVGATE